MQKLKLDVDSLAVVSFETGEDTTTRGTVEGNMVTVIILTTSSSLLTPGLVVEPVE